VNGDFNADELDPGIRSVVIALLRRGWDTTDSGDGSKAGTMECALPFRHVAAVTAPGYVVRDARRFLADLRDIAPGVNWYVEGSYSPNDERTFLFGYEKGPDEQ
jgi:hypothetical protein